MGPGKNGEKWMQLNGEIVHSVLAHAEKMTENGTLYAKTTEYSSKFQGNTDLLFVQCGMPKSKMQFYTCKTAKM